MKKKKKYINSHSKISFIGYSISKEGISPDKALIEKKCKKIVTHTNKNLNLFGDWWISTSDMYQNIWT